MKKINKYTIIFGALVIFSCSQDEFDIPNYNEPDATNVLADGNDLNGFNESTHTSLFSTQIGFGGIYMRGASDQFSTTNAYAGFWNFCDQPRRILENTSSNEDLGNHAGWAWANLNEVVNNANITIAAINSAGSLEIEGIDVTDRELAGAYFDKGVAQGYLAMIFDKAYVVNPGDTEAVFSTYSDVASAAMTNLQTAISHADNASEFGYKVRPNATPTSLSEFKQLIYSYMARFSLGVARTDTEAAGLDYDAILGYLNNGLTSDFNATSEEDVIFNNLQDWSLYTLGDGAGYMPTDCKIPHLFDPSYPADYPTTAGEVTPEAVSDDPRLTDYYEYVGDAYGFLRESRGRELFSSYRHIRYFDDNNENITGLTLEIFPKAEIDYMKAECYLRLNNIADAVSTLDNSPRKLVGNQNTTAAAANVKNALIYEYSIELDLSSGIAVNWAFMRRHDLLQEGTATHWPVPATELEISQDAIYTFGGPSNAGQPGTASGANDWRNINLVY